MIRIASLAFLGVLAASSVGCTCDPSQGGAAPDEQPPIVQDPEVDGRQPPPPAANGVAADGPGIVLAVRRIALGDTAPDGTQDDTAWQSIGFNLDRRVSDVNSVGLCQPAYEAGADTQIDGEDGIDNAFGRAVVPLMHWVDADPGASTAALYDAGAATLLVSVDGIGDAPSYSIGVKSRVLRGAERGASPAWNGDDTWPADARDLTGGQVESAVASFEGGWVTDRTWVSAPIDGADMPQVVRLPMALGTHPITLAVHRPLLVLMLAEDGASAKGTLAGILYPEELAREARRVLDDGADTCDAPAVHAVAQAIAEAADILSDGTQTPEEECDGISVGIGLELVRAKIDGVVTPGAEPNPCGD